MIRRILNSLVKKQQRKLFIISEELKQKMNSNGCFWSDTLECRKLVLDAKWSMFKIDIYKSLMKKQ